MSSLATFAIVIASLLPLSKNPHWVVRAMDFPRLQIMTLATLLLLVHFFTLDVQNPLDGLLIVATSLCVVWQLWWILPYTILWPKEVKAPPVTDSDNQLSIITANVLMHNRDAQALISLVEQQQPDILVTLETNTWWEEQLSVLHSQLPFSVKCPLENLYGMHVFSRIPFSEQEICFLVEEQVPSIHVSINLRCGDKVRLHFVHPAPPSPTENTESTERDAELITLARRIGETTSPVVVTGDLNDVAWSKTTRLFRKISGLLDPRVGRGMFNTFHASFPFLRWPLDHLFHSAHFRLKHIQRLPSIGSDHFALYTVLVYAPESAVEQDGLRAASEDFELAHELSAAKGASPNDVPKLDR